VEGKRGSECLLKSVSNIDFNPLYTEDGKQTPFASLEAENRALKRENAELALERDMLKKAAAYFASLQK